MTALGENQAITPEIARRILTAALQEDNFYDTNTNHQPAACFGHAPQR
jgi:hypothetical protein